MTALVQHVAEAFGLDFSGDREAQLVEAALDRARARRIPDLDAYLALLRDPVRGGEELRVLAGRLTVAESSFFRHAQQLEALVDVIRERLAAGGGQVRVLSAGCAGGEEPYSVALLLLDRFLPPDRARVEITALDIDPEQIRHAREAVYSAWSLRSTPSEVRERWFRAQGERWALDPAPRGMVRFEVRNLVAPDAGFWLPGGFDVIVCRNVLIYFTTDAIGHVVARFRRALHADGALFLGHSESLRAVTGDFVLAQAHDAFFYRPRRGAASPTPPRPATGPTPRSTAAVADASPRDAPVPAAPPREDPYLLLRQERYATLLAHLDVGAHADRDALQATCLIALDQIGAASDVLDRARDRDDARLHVLRGIIAERRGRPADARSRYEAAIAADATLAVAHLFLGRLLRRTGADALAEASLLEALRLLPLDQDRRLALVSGGFGRDLLIQVANAELEAAGRGH